MSLLPALLCAAVDAFVTRRSPIDIARDHRITPKEVVDAFNVLRQNCWQAKFAAALADPGHREDLLAIEAYLAYLEQQVNDLMQQYQDVRSLSQRLRAAETWNIKEILRTDALAFRIHSSAGRAMKELQKQATLHAKTAASDPAASNPIVAVAPPVAAVAPPTRAPAERSTTPTTPPQPTDSPSDTQTPPPPSHPEASPPPSQPDASALPSQPDASARAALQQAPPTTPPPSPTHNPQPPTPDILFKNRHRLKNTPAKHRPALIAKLLEQARA